MVDFSPFVTAIATVVVFVYMAIISVILLKIITKERVKKKKIPRYNCRLLAGTIA